MGVGGQSADRRVRSSCCSLNARLAASGDCGNSRKAIADCANRRTDLGALGASPCGRRYRPVSSPRLLRRDGRTERGRAEQLAGPSTRVWSTRPAKGIGRRGPCRKQRPSYCAASTGVAQHPREFARQLLVVLLEQRLELRGCHGRAAGIDVVYRREGDRGLIVVRG